LTRYRFDATLTGVITERITKVLDPVVAMNAAVVSDGAKAHRAFANTTGPLRVALVTSAGEHTWGTYRNEERQRFHQPPAGLDGALQGSGNGLPTELSRLAPEDRTRGRQVHWLELHRHRSDMMINKA